MSLTSYRAAPPRGEGIRREGVLRECRGWRWYRELRLAGPGGDLLSRVLRRSTIGAEGFHGRVRDGIGCLAPRHDHQVDQDQRTETRRPEAGSAFSGFWFSGFWLLREEVLRVPVRLCVARRR